MILVNLLLLLSVASYAHGRSCYSCNDYGFDGELTANRNCYTVTPTGSNPTTRRDCTDTAGVEYCRSTFTIEDGVVTQVSRACDSTGTTTNTIPPNQCSTTYNSGSSAQIRTATTTCVYTSNSNYSNTETAASFLTCSTDCNGPSQGSCNYINGSCHCNAGYSGSDCANRVVSTPRNCVQCSSETESSCAASTTSSPCSGNQRYCSTTVSKIFDQADNVVKTVTVRGCTTNFVATDQCSFSAITTDPPISDVGYREYTCYSTCNSDGCNTNTANGVIGPGESVPLQCVQCSETTGAESCNWEATRTPCASGSTYCKSTVTYLISEKIDRSYTGVFYDDVAYELRSVVRECATEAVTAGCTETTITGLDGLKKFTCTETCQVDGCNTGWPAAPKCIQCSSDEVIANLLGIPSDQYDDGYDECLENPPLATECDFPYQRYCFIFDVGIERDMTRSVQGYPRRVSRGCTHVDISTGCSSETVRSTTIESCNRTCTTDGCNAGSGGSMPIQTLIAVIVPVVLGWMAHIYL